MPSRKARPNTLERILEAALDLFVKEGYSGTTISEVERRVVLAAGTGSFYSHFSSKELQGGTQDNGTWENYGSPVEWHNTMVGDGGQSGFDVAVKEFRFHNFTGVSTDVNFNNGALADWIWISDGMSPAGTEFYAPVISDPKATRSTLIRATRLPSSTPITSATA